MAQALIWLVPAAVLLLGLWRPHAGFVALVACLPLLAAPPGGPYLAALDVAGIAAIGAVAARARHGQPGVIAMDWAVLAFVIVSLASMLPLAYLPPSFAPRVLLSLLLEFPYVQSYTVQYSWRAMANLLIGVALYRATTAAFRGRAVAPLGLALSASVAIAVIPGLLEAVGLVSLDAYRAVERSHYEHRLHSLFFHSGWLAEYLLLAAPTALATLATRGRIGTRLALLLAAPTLATVVLTQQRGAWLTALALGLALLPFGGLRWLRRNLAATLVTAALAASLLAIVALRRPAVTASGLEQARQVAAHLSGRSELWRAAVVMVRERPLLGVGLGVFAPAYDELVPRDSPRHIPTRGTAHSLYFSLAAERGLLGLAAASLVLALAVRAVLRLRQRHEHRALAHGLLASGVAFLVYGLVQYLLYLRVIEWMCWIGLGAVATLDREQDRTSQPRAGASAARVLIAIALIAAPIRALSSRPFTTSGSREMGLHESETGDRGSFRWCDGRAAFRAPRRPGRLVLPLANGHPSASTHPTRVVVRVDGEIAAAVELREGWRDLELEIREGDGDAVLEVDARPAFRPYVDLVSPPGQPPSSDIRRLGVAMGAPKYLSKAAGVGTSRAPVAAAPWP